MIGDFQEMSTRPHREMSTENRHFWTMSRPDVSPNRSRRLLSGRRECELVASSEIALGMGSSRTQGEPHRDNSLDGRSGQRRPLPGFSASRPEIR